MTAVATDISQFTTTARISSPKHYPFIDALRGWAVLGVMATHCGGAAHGATTPIWIDRLCAAGVYGVQLFFVVSALTLFLSLEHRYAIDRRPFLAFWARRIFRIAPLFLLAIPIYAALGQLAPKSWAPDGIPLWAVALTALFLHGWHPLSINSVVRGGWSIAVEMNFYILVPLLFLLIRSLRGAIAFTVGTAILAVIAKQVVLRYASRVWTLPTDGLVGEFTYYWLPTQLPIFGLGIVLFYMLRSEFTEKLKSAWHASLIPETALIVGSVMFAVGVRWKESIYSAHLLFGFAYIFMAFGLANIPLRLLVNVVTRFLGKISFSAYLAHFAVITYVAKATSAYRDGMESIACGGYTFVLFACVLAITVPIAYGLHYFIEQPGQNLGRAFLKRVRWSQTRVPQAAEGAAV